VRAFDRLKAELHTVRESTDSFTHSAVDEVARVHPTNTARKKKTQTRSRISQGTSRILELSLDAIEARAGGRDRYVSPFVCNGWQGTADGGNPVCWIQGIGRFNRLKYSLTSMPEIRTAN